MGCVRMEQLRRVVPGGEAHLETPMRNSQTFATALMNLGRWDRSRRDLLEPVGARGISGYSHSKPPVSLQKGHFVKNQKPPRRDRQKHANAKRRNVKSRRRSQNISNVQPRFGVAISVPEFEHVGSEVFVLQTLIR